MKSIEILISCMNQHDFEIINKSKICTDAIIINQCDIENYEEIKINNKLIRKISTKDRGLSKSRNEAIKNAKGDICVICDDDEIFVEGYEEKILRGYEEYEDADIIAYKLVDNVKGKNNRVKKIGFLGALKICSCQITFRRNSIIHNNIKFDEKLGSGTNNGPGEENKFLYECLKAGLKIYYIPIEIASVSQETSQWFNGYNTEYFRRRGMCTRYIMGWLPASVYGIYFILSKYNLYKNTISWNKALINLFKGLHIDLNKQ